jgi:uncharacterized protein involved in exopolysaccharide biosynthesis
MSESLISGHEGRWISDPDDPSTILIAGTQPPRSLTLSLVMAVLRNRRLVVGAGILAFVVGISIALIAPRSYLSQASFSLTSRSSPGNLASLAAQFGMNVGGGTEATSSPVFFAELLKSRRILGDLAASSFRETNAGNPQPLPKLLHVGGRTPAEKRDLTIRRLRSMVTTEVETRTGVVRVAVTAGSPLLAYEITNQLLEALERFNRENRASQAAAERRFAEGQLADAQMQLRSAEDRLQDFLVSNRNFRNAPQLVFENERLSRDVAARQQIYTSLMQLVQSARLDEERDTPFITLIEPPDLPFRPASRKLLITGVLSLTVGLLLGTILAVMRSYSPFGRSSPEERDELERLRMATLADLRSPWRPFSRVFGRSKRTSHSTR